MPRLLTLIVLLVCLGWQAWASAQAGLATAVDGDAAHALLHWSEAAHHHQGGDIQLDDSDASLSHVQCDHACCGSAAPPCREPVLGDVSPREAVPLTAQGQAPAPYPDRLLRPPRA